MTIPRFQLTKHKTVTCYRVLPGSYVNGDYVDGLQQMFQIEANVQPLKFQEQLQLKESERSREWLKVFTTSSLRALEQGDSGYRGDIVLWEGQEYQTMKVKHYSMGVLDHFCAYVARLETTVTDSYP